MNKGFIKLQRNPAILEIIQQRPSAWALLTLIALRARREKKFNSLEAGEAMIGDWKAYGASSERVYRTDKNWLKTAGLVTIKVTSRGTIAKLTSTDFYDLNIGGGTSRATGNRRARDEQETTNKNVKKEKKERKKYIGTPEQVTKLITSKNWKYYKINRSVIEKYVEKINDYVSSRNKKPYKDEIATIRLWITKDIEAGKLEKYKANHKADWEDFLQTEPTKQ